MSLINHRIDNPISSDGSFTPEITILIRELNLDVSLSPAPGPDVRDMAKHLSMTQERLCSTIMLQIEAEKTPVRDLSDRFDSSAQLT